MIRLTKVGAIILIISSLIISFSLVAIRLSKDSEQVEAARKLQKRRADELLIRNMINQMDSTSNAKYILVKKFKNDTWEKKMQMPQDPMSYQDMDIFLKYEKLWFNTYDYKIEIAAKTKATRQK